MGWDEYLTPSLSDKDRRVHAVLHDWFEALQDGSVLYRLPDPAYERPFGKVWTEEDLEKLVQAIDVYVWKQKSWVLTNRGIDADAGPGYARLTSIQRVAFAQALEFALLG